MDSKCKDRAMLKTNYKINFSVCLVLLIYLFWISYVFLNHLWFKVVDYWPATITMIFASFVSGATSEGGGFVAFPVFTKILKFSSFQASIFSLMIQSVGMGFASLFIFKYRIPILFNVIVITVAGGIVGVILGIFFIQIPDPWPKIIFTIFVTTFGIFLIVNRYLMPDYNNYSIQNWTTAKMFAFLLIGVAGGIVSSMLGTGINIISFIFMTLAFGINEKISTPTSVVIMAAISMVGFFIHYTQDNIGEIYYYWLAAIPVVCIGAPFGAYVASKLNKDFIILLLIFLISTEFISTLFLTKFTFEIFLWSLLFALISSLFFSLMMVYRSRNFIPDIPPVKE